MGRARRARSGAAAAALRRGLHWPESRRGYAELSDGLAGEDTDGPGQDPTRERAPPRCCTDEHGETFRSPSDAREFLEDRGLVAGKEQRHGDNRQQVIAGEIGAGGLTRSSGRSSRNSSEPSSSLTRDDSAETLTVDKVALLQQHKSPLSNEDFVAKTKGDASEHIELDRFDVRTGGLVLQKTAKDDLIQLVAQASPSLAASVLGEILAGWLLDVVQHWPVFVDVNELFMLVPILLNLKGNLEMNLAARLTTTANSGLLDNRRHRKTIIVGNLSLLQLQSLVIGAAAGLFSFVLGAVARPHSSGWSEVALIITASMGCAAISSFVLGAFMCALILCSRTLNINPANIATPLGTSLGDVVTLVVLAMCSNMLRLYMSTPLSSALFVGMLVCIPVWATVIYRNEYARHLIDAGWIPIFFAMVISSASGLILEKYIAADVGMALLAPVFNGIGGNVGSIFASRISSALHAGSEEAYAEARHVLFMLGVPNHAGFLLVTHLLGIGHVHVDLSFFALYMAASLVLSAIMLFLAERMTLAFWRRGCDPDNCVLPLLTALGDVFGTALLVIVFAVYRLIDPASGEPPMLAVPPTLRARALWI